MGKLSGTILILAGVALGASSLLSRHPTVADVAAPHADGAADTERAKATAANGSIGAVAPDEPARPALSAERAQPPTPPQPAPLGSAADATPPAKAPEVRVAATTEKASQPSAVRVEDTPSRLPVEQSKPMGAPPLTGEGLTRELQRQLRHAGCYGGSVTGVWSPSVRRAMKAFTDRANAALPVDQPDQILLALLQSNPQVTCGPSCPAGQAAANDGRCLPKALIAGSKKQPPEPPQAAPVAPAKTPGIPAPAAGTVASKPPAAPAAPPAGRMSLAGPRSEPALDAKAQAKDPSVGQRPRRATRRLQRPPRYAEDRPRYRRYQYRSPSGPFDFPWWAYGTLGP
jgi:peptidoglycan hydrolase-like protein with peptidoglycan-binding domain